MNNHLKKLVRFVYNDKDECYHFIDEYIINPSKDNIKSIKDSFIKMNKSFNNDFAYFLYSMWRISHAKKFIQACEYVIVQNESSII